MLLLNIVIIVIMSYNRNLSTSKKLCRNESIIPSLLLCCSQPSWPWVRWTWWTTFDLW